MTWVGRKKIAFIPVYRPNAIPPDIIPSDWENQIFQRVLFNPDPTIKADRSLRAYIHAASSGLADLDVVVMPMEVVTLPNAVVLPDALEPKLGPALRDQGFDAAALVMLGGAGSGTSQRGGFWARFVMLENLGTWAMELMHVLTNFFDLYTLNGYDDYPFGDIGAFDEMSCNCGTHPSAYTKAAINWLDKSAIANHTGRAAAYALHAVGLVQPPPSGRSTAVRIGSEVPYLMVEARLMVDQFESKSQLEPGIPSQGVIVYRVQTSDPSGVPQNNKIPVSLLTPTALQVGQTFTPDSKVSISVTGTIAGGFMVAVGVPWTSVSQGSAAPGSPVTALPYGERLAVFITDPNGGIYTTAGTADGGWGGWTTVAQGSAPPRSLVTAVPYGEQFALFITDPNGGIYTIGGTPDADWGDWGLVSDPSDPFRAAPGSPVTAVPYGGRFALFVTSNNGEIYTTLFS
jgi:hypothetical protein